MYRFCARFHTFCRTVFSRSNTYVNPYIYVSTNKKFRKRIGTVYNVEQFGPGVYNQICFKDGRQAPDTLIRHVLLEIWPFKSKLDDLSRMSIHFDRYYVYVSYSEDFKTWLEQTTNLTCAFDIIKYLSYEP